MNFLLDIKSAFLPEIIILFFILLNILFAIFVNKKHFKLSVWINILGILTALSSIIFLQAEPTYSAFNNSIVCNVYTVFFKSLILVATFFVVLLSNDFIKKHQTKIFEYYATLMTSVFCSLILVSGNDFLTIFVSLCLLIINNSLLIAMVNNSMSKVCANKYLINGVCATSIFALGVSYLYGITATLNLESIMTSLIGYEGGLLFTFAMIFIVLGLILLLSCLDFKILSTLIRKKQAPAALFLSLIPMFAIYAILSRILVITYNYIPIITFVILVLGLSFAFYCLLSMLKEYKINRFISYSIISQNSFILLVLSLINVYNIASLLYCLVCYLVVVIALFAGIIYLNQRIKNNELSIFNEIAYKFPFFATAMIFTFVALAGLPPTCGFWEKFFVLSSVLRLGIGYFPALLLILILFVISIIVYAKPIKLMFDKNVKNKIGPDYSLTSKIILYFSTVIIILLCFYSEKLVELCELIAYSLH